MKNGALIVFKKELARFFGDRRLLITSVIMPGLLIYLIYSFIGSSMNTLVEDSTASYKAAAVNMPAVIAAQLEQMNFEIETITPDQTEQYKEKVRSKDISLCVVFPDDFESVMANYNSKTPSSDVPNVSVFYNSSDINSSNAYPLMITTLDSVEKELSNVFDVNALTDDISYDVATEEDTTGTLMAMILPVVIMTLLYSSCVALAPESIAGEKERGTIASLLITPVPRSQIILGKVCALSVMSLLGGMSSFLGTFLSIPKLMQGMDGESGSIKTDVYGAKEYICLIVLILSTVLLLITVISIISTLAKSVKEAGTMVMPLMMVVMLVSFLTMYQTEVKTEFFWYCIPLYNTVECMKNVFSFSIVSQNIAVTCAANILYSGAGIFVLTKLFNNERVMFG